MLENIFPGTNLYLPLHLDGFEAKQKIPYSVRLFETFETSQKQLHQPRPPGESILLEFCQNVSDR